MQADYYWIPGGGRYHNTSAIFILLHHIRTQYPWWNQTVARGEARHIFVASADRGPGEAFGDPSLADGAADPGE